jgi:hypothetical protein
MKEGKKFGESGKQEGRKGKRAVKKIPLFLRS